MMKIFTKLFIGLISLTLLWACSSDSSEASSPLNAGGNNNNGQGGSLARFAISDNHLYIVNTADLITYDISNPEIPSEQSSTKIGSDIETIFPYRDMLFIGSQTGMLIYDKSNPTNPSFVSRYDHVQSCDPVVVQGDYAYVTLRSGTDCRFGQNLLDVIDISNPANPQVVNSYGMLNPHGLGVDGDKLFVCEGEHGLKVFDLTDPKNPQEIEFIENVKTYDVIPRRNVLIVTGDDGIFQYDYSGGTLTLLSQLD